MSCFYILFSYYKLFFNVIIFINFLNIVLSIFFFYIITIHLYIFLYYFIISKLFLLNFINILIYKLDIDHN